MNGVLLDWLAHTSWQAAIVVVLVLAADLALGRFLTPRWRYRLWFLVVLRVLLPVTPSVPGGIPRLDPLPSAPRIARPTATPERGLARAEDPQVGAAARARSIPLPVSPPPVLDGDPEVGPSSRPDGRAALAAVWALGALFFLARGLLSHVALLRRISSARRVDEGRLLAVLEECRRRAGVRRKTVLLATEAISSPAVAGIFRPRILVPEETLARSTEKELRHFLVHELAHVRRNDPLLNVLLLGVRASFWFHLPLLYAIARLRAAQESARDWEAMRAAGETSPAAYANTLLRFLERRCVVEEAALAFLHRRSDLKRRILMIDAYRPSDPRARWLGAGTLLGLVWLGFTAPIPAPLQPPTGSGQEKPGIAGTRQVDVAPWEAALREKLAKTRTWVLRDANLAAVADHLRETVEVNVVVHPEALEEFAHAGIDVRLEEASAEEFLRLVCRVAGEGLDWCLAGEAVVLAHHWNLPRAFEVRFYDAGPLLTEQNPGERSLQKEHLVELVMRMTEVAHPWDEDPRASIRFWNDLLVVSQRREAHAGVEEVLNHLLAGGSGPRPPREPWRAKLGEALRKRVEVSFEDVTLAEASARLRQEHALPLVANEACGDRKVRLRLANVEMATVLAWLASETELHSFLSDGAVFIDERPPYLVGSYAVGDLVAAGEGEDREARREELADLVRSHVAPNSWDELEEPRLAFWNDLLVVVQTEVVHAEIRRFLDSLRGALHR